MILVEMMEYGVLLKTKSPVLLYYMRNPVPAPDMGIKYGQNIEPSGRYMLHEPEPDPRPGWETGTVLFQCPIVMRFTAFNEDPYGHRGWKFLLFKHFGVSGTQLSRYIAEDGYDAVITLSVDKDGTPYESREIVDITAYSKAYKEKQAIKNVHKNNPFKRRPR